MPLQIVHRDICELVCDAIVNPTDEVFSGSGGTDLAIHTAAGPELDAECSRLGFLECGEVAVTGAYRLPCKYIIHTRGPVWQGGGRHERVLLRSCYMNALLKARELGAASVAFPLIASGTFGFPKDKVLRIATDAISDFLFNIDGEMDVTVCIKNRSAYELSTGFALREYIGENRWDRPLRRAEKASLRMASFDAMEEAELAMPCAAECVEYAAKPMPAAAAKPMPDLSEWIKKQDDSFAVMLLKLIDQKGMSDVQCYKKANVSKGTFWKINNDAKYKPSKATVLAFAIALELNMEETNQLLRTVGMSLSHSNLFDLIIEFYITSGIYDIFEINAALYQYDQICLGC